MTYICNMESGADIKLGSVRDIVVTRRIELGYSQRDISDKLGVSDSTIKRFERNGDIKLSSFLRLVEILDIQIFIDYGRGQ